MATGCLRIPIMFLSSPSVLWICYVVNMVLVVVGMFGNIMSYLILGYDKSRRNQSSRFYLRALAIADCLSLVCSNLLSSQQMMLRPALRLSPLSIMSMLLNSHPACSIRMYASYTTIMISVYIIVLFSVERALVLLNPFRWSRVLTLRKAKVAVATLVVSSCLLSLPALFSFNRRVTWHASYVYNQVTGETVEAPGLLSAVRCSSGGNYTINPDYEDEDDNDGDIGTIGEGNFGGRQNGSAALETSLGRLPPDVAVQCESVGECRINLAVFKPFAIFHIISLSVVPFVVTGMCNFVILTVLRRRDGLELRKTTTAAAATSTEVSDDAAVDRQVTKRLFLVSTTYIVLSFPLALFHIVTKAMRGTYCYPWAANALTIALTLNWANLAVNFVLYCISEGQFRRLLASLLHCHRGNFRRMLSYVTRPGHHRRRHGAPGLGAGAGGRGGGHHRGAGGGGGAGGIGDGTTPSGTSATDKRCPTSGPDQGGNESTDSTRLIGRAQLPRRGTETCSAGITDALIHHRQDGPDLAGQIDDSDFIDGCCGDESAASAPMLVEKLAPPPTDAHGGLEECGDCSLMSEDDWSSGQFSESGGGGGAHMPMLKMRSSAGGLGKGGEAGAATARWSEVVPESPFE